MSDLAFDLRFHRSLIVPGCHPFSASRGPSAAQRSAQSGPKVAPRHEPRPLGGGTLHHRQNCSPIASALATHGGPVAGITRGITLGITPGITPACMASACEPLGLPSNLGSRLAKVWGLGFKSHHLHTDLAPDISLVRALLRSQPFMRLEPRRARGRLASAKAWGCFGAAIHVVRLPTSGWALCGPVGLVSCVARVSALSSSMWCESW